MIKVLVKIKMPYLIKTGHLQILRFHLPWAKAVTAGQAKHDTVLAVHRHAVHQPGPQALVEFGLRVPIKTCFDGRRTSSGATELSELVREANGCAACEDARQVLHALDEPLDLPAPDHDLIDLLHDGIALVLGYLVPAHQRIVTFVVLLLVLDQEAAREVSRPAPADRARIHLRRNAVCLGKAVLPTGRVQ